MTNTTPGSPPLVRLVARPTGPTCPFGNDQVVLELRPGGCVALQGASGRGKTTIASVLAGIAGHERRMYGLLHKLHIHIDELEWNPTIPIEERCGVLFQQTTLLDELTVAGNLTVALRQRYKSSSRRQKNDAPMSFQREIKRLLEAVGLEYARDAHKRPTELSGGMGRRASLALQLAQHKHVIVLDEPFAGLDFDAAVSVAKELVQLRLSTLHRTALVLISHEPHLARLVMDPKRTGHLQNDVVELLPRKEHDRHHCHHPKTNRPPSLFGTTFMDRFFERLIDYVVLSLPLIGLAFVACGLAISMLSADLLQRLEISSQVLDLVDQEVRPLIKLLTGEEANALQMMGIRFKVNSMLNRTVPPAKATLYAMGLTKLFVLEIGPLLTALLLCGRIGGSYAGRVGTMEATSQNKLLQTLGVHPRVWTLWPALLAALIAGPVLTVFGTMLALVLGGLVGPHYDIGNLGQYRKDLFDSLFPVLRIRCLASLWEAKKEDDGSGTEEEGSATKGMISFVVDKLSIFRESLKTNGLDLHVVYGKNPTWKDTLIELATYPPVYHLVKSTAFIVIILGVAECVARSQTHLTPRGVPAVITFSVVSAGLLVIMADWAFSQLWLLRH